MPPSDIQPERNGLGQPGRHSLERLLSPHEVFPIVAEAGAGQPTWLLAEGWRLFARPRIDGGEVGQQIEVFTLPDGSIAKASLLETSRRVTVPFSFAGSVRQPRFRALARRNTPARTQRRPARPVLPREEIHTAPRSAHGP